MNITALGAVIISIFLFYLNAPGQKIENGWKRIAVFKSTRADVEKALGKPLPDSISGDAVYQTSEGNVVVVYPRIPCSDPASRRSEFALSEGTVIEYTVYPKEAIPLTALQWNKDDYAPTKSSHYSNTYHYTNTSGNIWISTRTKDDVELVQSIWFTNTVEQRKRFRCRKSDDDLDQQ